MTSQINEIINSQVPTLANFWWNASGPPISYTLDGDEYPYQHQSDKVTRTSDYRYAILTTPLFVSITFDAIGAENPENPKVITPIGVSVIQYLWNFGDGVVGYGPQPSHTYTAASPDAKVSLVVTDSRGSRTSIAKPLNLVYLTVAAEVGYKIRN